MDPKNSVIKRFQCSCINPFVIWFAPFKLDPSFLLTAPSRTPAVTNQRQIEFENDSDHGSKDTDKSLAVISREQYPFGEICSFISSKKFNNQISVSVNFWSVLRILSK